MTSTFMALFVPAFWLVAILFLRRRSVAPRHWPAVIAVTLAVVVTIVAVERAGYWPAALRVR